MALPRTIAIASISGKHHAAHQAGGDAENDGQNDDSGYRR